jgi:hypothetical protein
LALGELNKKSVLRGKGVKVKFLKRGESRDSKESFLPKFKVFDKMGINEKTNL